MAQVPIGPPPSGPDAGMNKWLWLLWRRLTQSGQFLWATLDFSGSNLTDIATRNHEDLQNLNTTDYTHLTSAQATGLTGGSSTALHTHDHGALGGLGDDDHTQYLLAAGTRAASLLPLTEQGSVATPSSGVVALYAKPDGYLYSKDDAGNETQLGGSSLTYKEPVSIWNGGSPEILFDGNGDVVMANAS